MILIRRGFVALICLATSALGGENPPPKGYVCGRAKAPIAVDGKLDDPGWQAAPWTDDFVDILGEAGPRPRFRTRAKMLWDDTYFYIAAELAEPHVWGTLTQHDSVIFQDNDFEVFIDPDGDNQAYYEVEVNVLNTEWDLLLEKAYRDGGPAVNAWEIPGLKTATHVKGTLDDPTDVDESWTIELAIPWEALKGRANRPSPPNDGDQWRVNFSRVEWQHTIEGRSYKKVPKKPEDNWVWSPQGLVDMHQPEHWGYVQFSAELPGVAEYQIDPSGPVRDRLMAIYHAQKKRHAKEKAWATSLEDLGLASLPAIPGTQPPIIKATPDGFEAEMTWLAADGKPAQTWTVRQDSRLARKP